MNFDDFRACGLVVSLRALSDGLQTNPKTASVHAVFQEMLLTSRPNMAEAMFSAALWAVSKVIRLAGPAIEASHPASVLRTLRDKPPTSVE
jgi:hypothetical protein